uniref:Reelin domain-containing protein n=1 Tax=Ascaris lumbricoides TaxID=6252 RepID=A0A0M3HQA8_ASCLU
MLHREQAAACPWYHKCYTANVSGLALCGNSTMRRAYVELMELHESGGSQRIDFQRTDLLGRFNLKGHYEETVLGILNPNLRLHVRWRCPPYPTDIKIPDFCFKKIGWNNWDVVCRDVTCTTSVTKHVNKAIHRFVAPVAEQTCIGPNRSIPVQSKGSAAETGGIVGMAAALLSNVDVDGATKSLHLAVLFALICMLHREQAAACPWYNRCYTANVSGLAVCGNRTMRRSYIELKELEEFGDSQKIDLQWVDLWGRFSLEGYYEETVLGVLKPSLQLHVRWRCPPYPRDINIPRFCFKKIGWNNYNIVCRDLKWDFFNPHPDFFNTLTDRDPYADREDQEKYETHLHELAKTADQEPVNH